MASYSIIYDKKDAFNECFNGTAKVVLDSAFESQGQEVISYVLPECGG